MVRDRWLVALEITICKVHEQKRVVGIKRISYCQSGNYLYCLHKAKAGVIRCHAFLSERRGQGRYRLQQSCQDHHYLREPHLSVASPTKPRSRSPFLLTAGLSTCFPLPNIFQKLSLARLVKPSKPTHRKHRPHSKFGYGLAWAFSTTCYMPLLNMQGGVSD